jgi:hypothetical protein
MIVTRTKALAIVAFIGTLGAIVKITFPSSDPIPTPEPIPTSEPILTPQPTPNSEFIAFGNCPSAIEEEFVPPWGSQPRNVPGDHSLWMVIGGLCSGLVVITTWFIYHGYLQDWHMESDPKYELPQITMMMEEGDRLRREVKTLQTWGKEEEGRRHAEFLKHMNSMKAMMEEEQRRCVESQGEMDSIKSQLKVRSGEHTHCQNALDAASNVVNMERGRWNKLWDEINRMKITLDISLSTSTKEETRRPASKQSPVKMRALTETHPAPSTCAAKQ